MTSLHAFTIPIGPAAVRAAWDASHLWVPMQPFVTEALHMSWQGQAGKLKAMIERGAARMLAVNYGKGHGTRHELCLRAARITAYLAGLRPTRARGQAAVAHLREHWEEALIAHLQVDPGIFPERGGYLAPLLEHAAGLERQLAAEQARTAELERELAAAEASLAATELKAKACPQAARALNKARWGERPAGSPLPYADEDWFLAMKAYCETASNAAAAKLMGVSRSAVSLLLSGRYGSNVDLMAQRARSAFVRP